MNKIFDHPEWHAHIRAIREEPESDLPRLAAADWLGDRGEDARQRFIRISPREPKLMQNQDIRRVPFYGKDQIVGTPDPDHWLNESERIRIANHQSWGWPEYGSHFRGFLHEVRCSWDFWIEHGGDLCQREPVQSVTIYDRRPEWLSLYFDGVKAMSDDEYLRSHLHLRWPQIRPENWQFPENEFRRLGERLALNLEQSILESLRRPDMSSSL